MNKYIILLLAVCLVGVSAFVKREAPAASEPSDLLENTKKQFTDAANKLAETFSIENINKGLQDVMANVNKAIDGLKPTEAPKA